MTNKTPSDLHHEFQQKILYGQLDDLPPLPPTTLKIFLLANFEEFDVERERFWTEVLPDIQYHCLEYGLDVVVVDMLHGRDTDPLLDHNELQRQIKELESCCLESCGPFFVCLLGDRYGTLALPSSLEEEEYQFIHSKAQERNKVNEIPNTEQRTVLEHLRRKKERNTSYGLLEAWYMKDTNAIPAVYTLNPVSTTNKNYRRPSIETNKSDKDKADWSNVHNDLKDLLQSVAKERGSPGKKDGRKLKDRVHTSGFDLIVRKALELNPAKCLFFTRDLKGLVLKDLEAERFCDIKAENKIDDEKRKQIKHLRDAISSAVPSKNRLSLSVQWKSSGICPSEYNCHAEYIENFTGFISTNLRCHIDSSMENLKANTLPVELLRKSQNLFELLIHLHHCRNILLRYSLDGYDEVLSRIQTLLIAGSRNDHQLAIVRGSTGSEKTVLVAKLCQKAREIFGRETVLIPRFIGLTQGSYFIEDILRNICLQINAILKQSMSVQEYDMKSLTNYFHGLLNRVSKSSRHLVIVLDGLEHLKDLSTSDGMTNIDWLASKLPPKLHIVVTYSAAGFGPAISRLESKLISRDYIVHLPALTDKICHAVLKKSLDDSHRRMSPEQETILRYSFKSEKTLSQALFLTETAVNWHSNDKPTITNGSVVKKENMVEHVFDSLEKEFGVELVGAIAGYITLSLCGLTEMELLDLLSSNNDLILACFPNGLPLVLRFPSSLWVHFKQMTSPLLTTRYVHCKTVMTWSKQSCFHIVRQRYLSDSERTVTMHRDIAQLFLETWNDNKPLVDAKRSIKLLDGANRILCPQPLLYSHTKYNVRRLQELWFQLLKAGEVESFKEYTFCCFEYLLATADSSSVQDLIHNIQVALSLLVDADVELLKAAILASSSILEASPLQLASELIGRLRQIKDYFSVHLQSLVTQCMEWCDSYSYPLVVPLTTWLPNLHNSFLTSFTAQGVISCIEPLPKGQHLLIGEGSLINMYHVASKKKVKSFLGHTREVTCMHLSGAKSTLLSGSKDGTIRVWNVKETTCSKVLRHHSAAVLCMTVMHTGPQIVSGSEDGKLAVYNLETESLVEELKGHDQAVTGVALNRNNTVLVSASLDKDVILWNTNDWEIQTTIHSGIDSPIICMDLSIDNTFILVGCESGSLHLLSFTTGSWIQQLNEHQGKVLSVAFCENCHHAIVASTSGLAYMYNFRSMEVIDTFRGAQAPVTSIAIAADQQVLFTASKGEVFVWSLLKKLSREVPSDDHSGPVSRLVMTPDGKHVISGGLDGMVKTWQLDISDFSENFIGHSGPVTALAVSSDSSYIVTGSADKTVRAWSLIRASLITNYKNHSHEIQGVHVLSDNRLALSLDSGQAAHLWRAEDGQMLQVYTCFSTLHAMSSDGRTLITSSGDHRVRIQRLSDGSLIEQVTHSDKVTCMFCSLDNKYLVTGSKDRSVKICELQTGKLTQILAEHADDVSCVLMTSDSNTILSGANDGIILVCALNLGTSDRSLVGHTASVTAMQLTKPNDILLISGSLDNTIRVWNYQLGYQLTLFDMHNAVVSLVMTDTAERIAVQMADDKHVAILCLHNSPAAEAKRQEKCSIGSTVHITVDICSDPDENSILPIKPKPPLIHHHSAVFPVHRRSQKRPSSTSSLPQIVKFSPMKAPVQSTVEAQENKKKKALAMLSRKKVKRGPDQKEKSSVCSVL